MGHNPRIAAQEENNWDLEQAARETEKNFSTDLQLLMTETTSPSNRHQFIAQGPSRHKQNDSRRTTLLVATDD